MAYYGVRGLTGWPLPPPPLIEGVDRRAHRQARNWNTRFQQLLQEQQSNYQVYHQDQERLHLPAGQQEGCYSPELKTVLRTSPLRKWSQETFARNNNEVLTHVQEEHTHGKLEPEDGLEEQTQIGQGTTSGEQETGISETCGLLQNLEKYKEDESCRLGPDALHQKESTQVNIELDDGEVTRSVESVDLSDDRQGSPQDDVLVSLCMDEDVLSLGIENEEGNERKTEWRRDSEQYFEDDVFDLTGVDIVEDVDVEGKCGMCHLLMFFTD